MYSAFRCAVNQWSPQLGDNHFMGWLTVAVYILAALASAHMAMRGRFPDATQSRERGFWWLTFAFLAFLAINKQLDLQSLMTSVARCIAVEQGWYEDRRALQRGFIVTVLLGASLSLMMLGLMLWGTLARTGLALVGLLFVCAFVVIRAASFHHFDILIGSRVLGLRINWLLELPGPLIIMVAATRAGRSSEM